MLQCVADCIVCHVSCCVPVVCCSVLQCVAVCCIIALLQCCSVLQIVLSATYRVVHCCSELQCVAACCSLYCLPRVVLCSCSVLFAGSCDVPAVYCMWMCVRKRERVMRERTCYVCA